MVDVATELVNKNVRRLREPYLIIKSEGIIKDCLSKSKVDPCGVRNLFSFVCVM